MEMEEVLCWIIYKGLEINSIPTVRNGVVSSFRFEWTAFVLFQCLCKSIAYGHCSKIPEWAAAIY